MTDNSFDLIAARSRELAERSEYSIIAGSFLSPAEQVIFHTTVRGLGRAYSDRLFFFGGCPRAERRCAVFLPEYEDLSDAPPDSGAHSELREDYFARKLKNYDVEEDIGITQIEICGSGYEYLSHRDYMGSILALGIDRSVVGDIVPDGNSRATVFVSCKIADYISSELRRAGRDHVKCRRISLPEGFAIRHEFEEIHVVAASDRSDAVVAALTGSSRSAAKEMCTAGLVDVGYITREASDQKISQGDTISVRGFGKFIIDSFDGETRSGRLHLSARKYV